MKAETFKLYPTLDDTHITKSGAQRFHCPVAGCWKIMSRLPGEKPIYYCKRCKLCWELQ